jgi:hypothetical protein
MSFTIYVIEVWKNSIKYLKKNLIWIILKIQFIPLSNETPSVIRNNQYNYKFLLVLGLVGITEIL